MSYQALYRVWRPQRFDDIAGQTAVTRTLKNALMQKKNSHAYLFTGPRGTGKTSAAKIFAKAINCPNQADGEPCNDCEICQAITEGRLNDVIEIDAASNNGVEEIRDIRDKARYAPTQAEYKIYIIDEVHMLSTGAFNALLKTLEEPPEKVIFILATTEPHKIPLTIISRTQRFDFKRISFQAIIDRMTYILGQEKIEYEPEALPVITRAANGGMRDALSLLDQVIAYDSAKVTFEHAVQVSGSLTEDMMVNFLRALWQNEPEHALTELHDILAAGKEAGRFLEELILFVRDLLVFQQTKSSQDTGQKSELFLTFQQEVEAMFLYDAMEAFSQTQKDMRFSTQPDVYLEVLAVKLAQPRKAVPTAQTSTPVEKQEINRLEQDVATLKKELSNLLEQVKNGGQVQTNAVATSPRPRATANQNKGGFKPDYNRAQKIMREAVKDELVLLKSHWVDVLDSLSVTQRAVLRQAEPVAANGNAAILSFEYEILCQKASSDQDLQVALDEAIRRMTDRPGEVVCVTVEQWATLRKSYVQDLKAGKIPAQKKVAEKPKPDIDTKGEKEEEQPNEQQVSGDDWITHLEAPPTFEADEEETQENEIIEQAVSLFGENVVKIMDE